MSAKLTVQRLFSNPPLNPGAPANLKFSRSGEFVCYSAAGLDDRERLDLWKIIPGGTPKLWLDARSITITDVQTDSLTDAEKAERERKRQFSHGITQYFFLEDDDHLLIPMDGQAYLCSYQNQQWQASQLTCDQHRQSSFVVSPNYKHISYVRDNNLYVLEIASKTEMALTSSGTTTLSHGLADFLAAEEMHRFEGMWWSPDSQFLAYTTVDESTVPITQRLEVEAQGSRLVPQRYPYAGGTNPRVSLHAVDIANNQHTLIWQDHHEGYLARVNWISQGLFIQCQDRRQQELILQRWQGDEDWKIFYQEKSSTWVNLTDDFQAAADQNLLFTSETSGQRKLLKISAPLEVKTYPHPAHINQVLASKGSDVYVSGWDHTPIENHLYCINLDSGSCTSLTSEPGWHQLTAHPNASLFIDHLSTPSVPFAVTVLETSGTKITQQKTLFETQLDSQHPYHEFLTAHSEAQYITTTSEDGFDLHVRLTPPSNYQTGTTYPVVIYVYGGPGAQKVRFEWPALLNQLFAQNGIGVLELDNRGATNRGRNFEAAIYKQMGTPEVQDQLLGFDILCNTDWADLNKVAIFGHSYGGYMSLMCASKSDKFKAAVAVAPVCDWLLYDTHYTERYMGLPDENPQGYAQANVLSHLENLNTPLLLMHGMADDNVLFSNTTMIMSALQKLNKSFELMTYPGSKHAIQEQHAIVHRFETILSFLRKHLQ